VSKETRENGYWLSENIPDSWEWAEFEEIFEDVTSSKKKLQQKSYLEIGCYPVIDQGQESVGGYHDDDSLAYDGLLPVIIFGDHSRCVKFIETKFIQGADGVKVLRPTSVVIERFVYCALSTIRLPDKGYSRHFKFLRASKFPIPPFNEQRRIVAKIEALKAHSQRVKEELEAIPALLDQFRQSVLAAAFRGDLTADWREKNPDVEPASVLLERIRAERRRRWEKAELEKMKAQGKTPKDDKWKEKYKELESVNAFDLLELPEGWCWASFAEVSKRVTVGHVGSMKDEYIEEGIPFLRSQNVRENRFDPEGLQFICQEFHKKLSKSSLQPGDLVVVRSGSVGVACVIPETLKEANCSDLVIVKQPQAINPHYGAYYMNSVARSHVNAKQVGVALTHFNTQSMAEMPIPVPPLAEQQKIVHQVQALFKIAEYVEQQYKEVKADLSSLDRSILAKAFRGELVPQDPNDEPASVLLERIRAEREKLDTKKKAKGKTEKKSRKAKPEAAEPKQLSLPGFE
jgi:type I restriction enzyme S subunit